MTSGTPMAGVALLAALALLGSPSHAATIVAAPAPVQMTMPHKPFDHMVGCWDVTGTLNGKPVTNRAEGHWLVDGAFFLLRLESTNAPRRYQADVFYGWDAGTSQIVVHWLDTLGGGASRTLGVGQVAGGALDVVFDYPDGKLDNRVTVDTAKSTFRMLIVTPPNGPTFADYAFAPRACAPGELIEWTLPADTSG
ncbi:MAG: hypothetical protein ACHP84_03420 [Caulobacterales bacterium]